MRIIYFKTLKRKNIYISNTAYIDKETIFEGNNKVGKSSKLYKCFVGRGSYFGDECIVKRTSIGKYCSIGSRMKIIDGNHPTNTFVSTYPSFYRKDLFCQLNFYSNKNFEEYSYTDKSNNWFCEIGNDCWIGDSVSIINGVKIGDGAIIAAGAMVTKDVPPYAIVGGIPAKVIKYRFNNEQIKKLLEIKWWNWPIKKIENNAYLFTNIKNLIIKYTKEDPNVNL